MIIHFSPLELYPPVQNLLHELEKAIVQERVIVVSTKNSKRGLSTFETVSTRIAILRPVNVDGNQPGIKRYIHYIFFYLYCLFNLIRYAPKRVLYFETISSFPVYIYKRFIRNSVDVFIHYHEYTSPAEYASGMTLVKWFHRLERWLYPRAKWVSHTNQHRMDQFKRDIAPGGIQNCLLLPNYPPKSWRRQPRRVSGSPLKIVYAGALSLQTMYTRQFAEWVLEQKGRAVLDIYTYNCTDEARAYIENLRSPFVNIKHGVDYHDLPAYFDKYDVGVILYNGHIPNYVYNAPNKLFEYWACGLSVWFPNVMIGCMPYCTRDTFPAVVAVDFDSLDNFSSGAMIKASAPVRESSYFCEEALKEITYQLLK